MMHILAIGECMAEIAPTDADGTYKLGFAGDTFNTAWYLARTATDARVSYLTVVGQDTISNQMTAFMRDGGIDDDFIRTSPDRTVGLYMISLDNGERSFAYWRGQSAAKGLGDDQAYLDNAMAQADLIYFSGITLAILPPTGRANLLASLGNARAEGKTIVFDPNLRPALWDAPEEMTKVIMQGASVSYIVLPSFEDEETWFQDENPDATAQRYLDAGAVTVIVKNGAGEVLFAEGTHRGTVNVTPVANPVDTTAAGDSFNAGVLARHVAGDALRDGIGFACNLSRAVVQQRGALVSIDADALAPTHQGAT